MPEASEMSDTDDRKAVQASLNDARERIDDEFKELSKNRPNFTAIINKRLDASRERGTLDNKPTEFGTHVKTAFKLLDELKKQLVPPSKENEEKHAKRMEVIGKLDEAFDEAVSKMRDEKKNLKPVYYDAADDVINSLMSYKKRVHDAAETPLFDRKIDKDANDGVKTAAKAMGKTLKETSTENSTLAFFNFVSGSGARSVHLSYKRNVDKALGALESLSEHGIRTDNKNMPAFKQLREAALEIQELKPASEAFTAVSDKLKKQLADALTAVETAGSFEITFPEKKGKPSPSSPSLPESSTPLSDALRSAITQATNPEHTPSEPEDYQSPLGMSKTSPAGEQSVAR